MKNKISLILSTYKSEAYLRLFMDSILAQSAPDEIELITVLNDAGETEKEIISEYAGRFKSGLKVLFVERETLYCSWNRAIREATGNYIGIANADDIRTPESINLQLRALESSPEALFCYGTFTIVRKFPSNKGKIIIPMDYDREEFTRSMILGPFFIWRADRGTSARLYFDEQFKSGGDFDFAIRLALCGPGVRVKENLGYYYDGGGGLSTDGIIQPTERTVIDLRYGIFDKILYDYLPEALKYDTQHLLIAGVWRDAGEFVPDYDNFINNRRQKWFEKGIRNHCRKKNRLLSMPLQAKQYAISMWSKINNRGAVFK
ncbi:MAG: glycosyltransferase [Nitrospirae bacterium YQR-1]